MMTARPIRIHLDPTGRNTKIVLESADGDEVELLQWLQDRNVTVQRNIHIDWEGNSVPTMSISLMLVSDDIQITGLTEESVLVESIRDLIAESRARAKVTQ